MKYTIKQCEIISEDGVATKQLLTLLAERENGVVSEHGKFIDLEADPIAEAEIYGAELSLVLKDEPIITSEPVEISKKDMEISEENIQARLDAKAVAEEILEEPILEANTDIEPK